jgi:NAD dependent epimerase/dehydratase family enzyme
MLPFKLGLGGPVAGGDSYMPWISLIDEVGILLWALDNDSATGAYNATAPEPVSNREFSKALGRALGRPAVMPVPKFAVKLRLGAELGEVAVGGQRALPRRARDQGYSFVHPDIESGLRAALE